LSQNLVLRIIVAAIFGPLIILISYLGGYFLYGMIMLLALIGLVEYMIRSNVGLTRFTFYLTLAALVFILHHSMLGEAGIAVAVFIGYFMIVTALSALRNISPAELFESQARLLWGVVYLGFLYPFVFAIRNISDTSGGDWLLFLFGTLWLSDTLAMFAGKTLGKRRLAPTVSPNKTIAGFLGGLLGGLIVAMIMSGWRLSEYFLLLLVGAGLAVSLAGQLGDLVESCWKRSLNIKDSSAIIPGHGGVLDRFDSLLFAVPVLYLYLKYIIYG